MIALFPLNVVLFPGSLLSLRIFESRYLDLVRECTRNDLPFGVVLIESGTEAGQPAMPVDCGCSARIVDFATLPDGLLGITVCGEQRFRVRRSTVEPSGLRRAEIDWLPGDPDLELPPEHSIFELLLRRLADEGDDLLREAEKARFDDAAWVAWRLAERLPLSPRERLKLLETDSVSERLTRLSEWLPRFQTP